MAENRYTVKMSPEVTGQFYRLALDWFRPYLKQTPEAKRAKLFFKGEEYLDEEDVKKDLQWILQDNRIDNLEAPRLYKIARRFAGDDRELSSEEAENTINDVFRNTPISVLDYIDSPDVTGVPLLMPDISSIENYKKVFEGREKVRLPFIKLIAESLDYIAGLISQERSILKDMEGEESSYLNFISAENLWGVSALISHDSRPFSALEIDARKRFIERLRQMEMGLDIFYNSLRIGYFPEGNRYIQALYKSPMAELCRFDLILNSGKKVVIKNSEEAMSAYLLGLIKLAIDSGSTRLAVEIFDASQDGLTKEHQEIAYKILPGFGMQFVDGGLRKIANVTLSLDSLGAVATGSAAISLVGRSATAMKALNTAAKIGGGVNRLLPGVRVFGVAAAGDAFLGLKGARMLGNLAGEMFKISSFAVFGTWFSKKSGFRVGADAYLFLSAGIMGYGAAKLSKLAGEIMSGQGGEFTMKLVKSGMSEVEFLHLAKQSGGVAGHQTFRLTRRVGAEKLVRVARRVYRETYDLQLSLERLAGRVNDRLGRAHLLAEQNPAVLGDDFLRQADEAVRIADPATALRTLKEILRAGRAKVGNARAQQTTPTVVRPVTTVGEKSGRFRSGRRRVPRSGGGEPWRNGRSSEGRPDSATGATDTSKIKITREPTTLDLLLNNPPKQITKKIISGLTNGKVKVDPSVSADLKSLYAQYPRTVLHRLAAVTEYFGDGVMRGWKKIRALDGVWRGRVGNYRIIAVKNDAGFKIVGVVKRENLDNFITTMASN